MKIILVWFALYQLKSQKDWRKPKDWQKRCKIIDRLGKLKHPLAVDALLEVINENSEDGHCTRHAVIALGEIGDKRAVDALLPIIWECEGEVPEALGKIGDSRAIKPLLEIIAYKDHWPYKWSAVRGLTLLTNVEVVEPLINLATNPEYGSLAIEGLVNNLKMISDKISNEQLQRIIDLKKVVQETRSGGPMWDQFDYYPEVDTTLVKHLAQKELDRRDDTLGSEFNEKNKVPGTGE